MKGSAFGAGISAAVMSVGLLWMVSILTRAAIAPEVYLSVALTVAFTVPIANWLKDGLLTLSGDVRDQVAKWGVLLSPPPAAPTPAVPTPAPLPATQRTDVLESIIAARAASWKTAKWIFFNNGERVGFTHTSMAGLMPEDQWGAFCRFYASEAGHSVLRLVKGNGGYELNAPLWTHARVLKAVEDGELPTPYPNATPPNISPATSDAMRRRATKRKTQADGAE